MTALFMSIAVVVSRPVLPLADCLQGKYPSYEKHLGKAYEVKKLNGFEQRKYRVPSSNKIAFVELTNWKSKDGTVNVVSLVFRKGAATSYKEALEMLGVDQSHATTIQAFPNEETVKIVLGLRAGKFITGTTAKSSSGVSNPRGGDFSATWYGQFDDYKEGAVLQIESPAPLP